VKTKLRHTPLLLQPPLSLLGEALLLFQSMTVLRRTLSLLLNALLLLVVGEPLLGPTFWFALVSTTLRWALPVNRPLLFSLLLFLSPLFGLSLLLSLFLGLFLGLLLSLSLLRSLLLLLLCSLFLSLLFGLSLLLGLLLLFFCRLLHGLLVGLLLLSLIALVL
jgi:hypothetical protein